MKPSQKYSHPIFDQIRLAFETPQVRALNTKIDHWVRNGITGGVAVGDARTGKSKAIELIRNNIKSRKSHKPYPSHVYRLGKRDVKTVANCYRTLYMSATKKPTGSAKTDFLFHEMVQFFVDLAISHDSRSVILFVDEFQRLSVEQLMVFADLQDDLLDSYDVVLRVYFFGNRGESTELLEKVAEPQYNFLYGRFFFQKYRFYGIRTIEELRGCLKQYDTLRYPKNDGPTYTEFFMPVDYAKGWRLESLANIVWSAYQEAEKGKSNWGMKYFVGTVTPLLADYLPQYGIEKANMNMIRKCIKVSGIIPDKIEMDLE